MSRVSTRSLLGGERHEPGNGSSVPYRWDGHLRATATGGLPGFMSISYASFA